MASTKITDWLGEGTHANRPATPPATTGSICFYYETDTATLFFYDFSTTSWVAVGGSVGGEVTALTAVPALPGFDPGMIYNAGTVLSNSNKTATPASSSPYNYNYGTTARYTGKRYMEWVPGSTSFAAFGFCGASGRVVDTLTGSPGPFGTKFQGQIGWDSTGAIKGSNGLASVTVSTVATWVASNVLCMAIDLDTMLGWFRVGAGNWNNNASGDPVAEVLGIDMKLLLSGAGNKLVWPGGNMGNVAATIMRQKTADFTQTVPTGYTSWSGL